MFAKKYKYVNIHILSIYYIVSDIVAKQLNHFISNVPTLDSLSVNTAFTSNATTGLTPYPHD